MADGRLTLTFRDGLAADVGAIVELIESAYRGEASRAGWTTEADLLAGRRTGPDELAPALDPDVAETTRFLLAETGDALVGCCRLDRTPPGALFGMFAVAPDRQGAGIGSMLLARAEEWVQARWQAGRLEMTVLSARPELLAYYLRHGYAPTGETRPFPYGDERFGHPLREDLAFVVLSKPLGAFHTL